MKLCDSMYVNGNPNYVRSIIVRTNKIEYLLEKEKKHFSAWEIHTGKVHWFDLTTGKRTCEDNLE